MKKSFTPLTALLLVIAVALSACGSPTAPDADTDAPSASSATAPDPTAPPDLNMEGLPIVNEKITLNIMQSIRDMDDIDVNGLWFVDMLEEKTNIHIDYEVVKGGDWEAKTNLMFASGKYPDIIMGAVDYEEYGVTQKLVLPLDDLIDQYMPIYKERLGSGEDTLNLKASDGQVYAIGNLGAMNYSINGHLFINKTWLDNLEFQIPATVDELTQVLRAFKDNDPNSNGQKDEIPFQSTFMDDYRGLLPVFSFWGIPENTKFICFDEEDKIQFTPRLNGYREALEWLSMIYTERLLDPECISQDTNVYNSKLNEDNNGLFVNSRMMSMSIDPVLDDFVLMLPVSAQGYQPKIARALELASARTFVTVTNEHIPETMRWFDTCLETQTMFESYYGPEGELWEWSDDGKITLLNTDQETGKYAFGVNGLFYAPGDYYLSIFNMPDFRLEKVEYCNQYEQAGVIEKNSSRILTSVVPKTSDEASQIALFETDIKKFMEESVTAFILQGVTDQSWQEFQDRIVSMNVDEYLSLYQAAYDRYQASN